MTSLKVLNVNVSIDSSVYGGTAERTYQLSRFLSKQGIECKLLVMTIAGSNQELLLDLDGVEVITLPSVLKRFYVPAVSLSKLESIVKSVDIIHLIGHWTLLNALIYHIARRLKKPYVFSPAGALPIYGRSKILKKIYNIIIGNRILKNANGYIAITQDETALLQQHGINKNAINLIPNGVCIPNFSSINRDHFFKKWGIPDKKYILYMGRLNLIKGPDLLLKAYSQIKNDFPDYHFIFAGFDDGLLHTLQKEAKSLGLEDRVCFLGYISGEDKTLLYYYSTMLVIPSRKEAMSIVVLEAGILEKAVLITDQCGFPELAQISGGLIVPANTEGLEQGLRTMLTNTNELAKMGKRLKQYITDHYTWDSQVKKLVSMYKKILSSLQ